MPLDSMGGFEDFCCFLPFYPSVVLGRITTGALTSFGEAYRMSGIGIGSLCIFLVVSIVFSILAFRRQMTHSK